MIKSEKYTFSLISLGALLLETALFGLCLYQAVATHGSSGLEIGCMGLLAFLIGIIGFRMAWIDRELLGRLYRFPLVMMILQGLLMILLIAVYLLGAVG